MAIIPQFLHMSVVGVFMREEEGGSDGTSIRISAIGGEDFLVYFPVLIVDSIVKGKDDHLRCLFRSQISRDPGGIDRTEAVRKSAVLEVTSWRSVWIVLRVTVRLV